MRINKKSGVSIARTHNGRFGKIAALAPQKRQCELGSYYPAGTLVKPLPRQAADTLAAIGRDVSSQNTLTLISTKN